MINGLREINIKIITACNSFLTNVAGRFLKVCIYVYLWEHKGNLKYKENDNHQLSTGKFIDKIPSEKRKSVSPFDTV